LLQLSNKKFKITERGVEELAHLRVRCLSQGGPGGHCRYPAYRVPLHTSFKSRQGARRASTRRHPIVPDPAFQPRWALASSRVQWFQILPPCSRGLRRCYMSRGSGPRLPAREGSGAATCTMAPNPASLLGRAPTPPRVPRHRTLPPYREGSGAVTRPLVPCGPRASSIKKN
jgi:hypothetical protein